MIKATANERKRKERERDKELGLIRRDIKAHGDDWHKINAYVLELKEKRNNKKSSETIPNQ